MSTELTKFDYGGLDKPKLVYYAGQFAKAMEAHTKSGMAIGQIVAEAHALFAEDGRDGLFSKWVESELRISRQTAYNYMWAFERFGNCKTVLQFDAAAMYALASPKVPPEAAKEAQKLADKGHRIDKKKAKELVARFSDKPKRAKSNGKPLSQSDAPPTPAEDEPAQDEPIDAPKVEETAVRQPSGGTSFNPSEWTPDSKDAFGAAPPDDLRTVFEICEEFDAQRAKITGIKTWITQRLSHPGAKVLEGAAQRIRTDLDQADSELKFAKPYCVCVYCHNKSPKVANCTACKGLGWITEPIYKAAPKGMKRETVKA